MILTGMSLETLMAMDILTFNALLPIANRVVYRNKAEDAWAMFIAMNGGMSGKREGVEKMTNGWLRDVGIGAAELAGAGKRSGKDFLRDFKIGSGGRI
jgi:hypothetical protein